MLFDQALQDTSQEAEKIQIDLLRQAGQARRIHLMLSLSQSMSELAWDNFQKTNPNLSDLEQKIKYVELLYGEPLATAFKNFLNKENNA